MSQKSVPAKQFNLDEIIESNMYQMLRVLDGEVALNFMLHMIKTDILGLLGITRGRCILVGFILLERFASKSGSKYGKTLARFRAGSHIG